MRTLFVAWQSPSRIWFTIGMLEVDGPQERYRFAYTGGALDAERQEGFRPLHSFPSFHQVYASDELFPFFQNRVLSSSRSDFLDYLHSLDLDSNNQDPIAILQLTGGKRETDEFEVFPKIEPDADGKFRCRFFLHGWRYMNEAARNAVVGLEHGTKLGVCIELTNPRTGLALLLTADPYNFVGWAPRYLVPELIRGTAGLEVSAEVVRVNVTAPNNRRVLVEFCGRVADYEPMSSPEFSPLANLRSAEARSIRATQSGPDAMEMA